MMGQGFDLSFSAGQRNGRNASDGVPLSELPLSSDPTGAFKKAKGPEQDQEQRLLMTLNNWLQESRDSHAANRAQQHKDADYYDHHQIADDVAAAMAERGQAPLQYNLIKAAIDWIIGTERRTRIDWKIHPRGPEDQSVAIAKQHALKYIDDVNDGSYARSSAFTQCVKVGIGWLEESINDGGDEEPITLRAEDWKVMWWDPFARKLDLSDARYIHRVKWLDIDYAIAMFPQHRDAIERNARTTDEIDLEDAEDPADVPGMFFTRSTHSYDTALNNSASAAGRRTRSRVRMIETWYRKPVHIKRLTSIFEDLNRKVFDADDAGHVAAIQKGAASLVDGVRDQMCVAIWMPGLILSRQDSPYRHNRYPFTPIFAYRDDKSGMPYGPIRGMRDAQDDYNKRAAKALFLLSTNRLIYEDGVVDEENEDTFKAEAAAPNAQLRVRAGALQNNRIRFEDGAQLAQAQFALMEVDKLHIHEGNGITRENLGQDSNAISGRAILAKQQQGSVTTAELFDNYRFSFRTSGKKGLSLIEQYMTLPKRIRIVGAKGAMDWLTLNEPVIDPETGELIFLNDLAAAEADYFVDQQDYRETVRMAMAEQLFEVMRTLPPEMQVGLLDLAIEMTDIPNREEFVKRIRAMNGRGPSGEENAPDALAKKQAEQASADEERRMAIAERAAKVRKENAQALKFESDARKSNVEGKAAALNTAALLNAAIPLAPAADRLAEFPAQETPK